jgi:hypothetical protein
MVMEQFHEQIPTTDLRTKNDYRRQVELLRRRVHLLRGTDRLLMTMYLENNNSYTQMAKLIGIDPVNVSRRIRKITTKLISGHYIKCLKKRQQLTSFELALAKEHFLIGMSLKKIAQKENISYYKTQQIIRKIKNIISEN